MRLKQFQLFYFSFISPCATGFRVAISKQTEIE